MSQPPLLDLDATFLAASRVMLGGSHAATRLSVQETYSVCVAFCLVMSAIGPDRVTAALKASGYLEPRTTEEGTPTS